MFDLNSVHEFENLIIEKNENQSGKFEIWSLPNTKRIVTNYENSLPFSRDTTPFEQPSYETGEPDTPRQRFFECCCHHLRIAKGDGTVPYRFKDANGTNWRMDKSSAYWLAESSEWERLGPLNEFDLSFRLK